MNAYQQEAPTIVKDSPEITRQIEHMGKAIEELGYITDALAKRLTPILSPLAAKKEEEKQISPAVSPIAMNLRSSAYKIESITATLKDLLETLEI